MAGLRSAVVLMNTIICHELFVTAIQPKRKELNFNQKFIFKPRPATSLSKSQLTHFINIVFTFMHCTCLHILQAIRFEQISFLASCSDHSREEPGSGLIQCTLCVSCPQVVKCFSCSFSSDQPLAVMFHINAL